MIFQSSRPASFGSIDVRTVQKVLKPFVGFDNGTVIAETKMRNSAASKIMRSVPTFCRTMNDERNTYRSTYAELMG